MINIFRKFQLDFSNLFNEIWFSLFSTYAVVASMTILKPAWNQRMHYLLHVCKRLFHVDHNYVDTLTTFKSVKQKSKPTPVLPQHMFMYCSPQSRWYAMWLKWHFCSTFMWSGWHFWCPFLGDNTCNWISISNVCLWLSKTLKCTILLSSYLFSWNPSFFLYIF